MIPKSSSMFGDLSFFPFAVENDEHAEDVSLPVNTETQLPSKKRSASAESSAARNGEEKAEDKKENSLSFSNANFDPAVAKRDDLPKGDKPAVKDSTETEDKTEKDADPTPVPSKEEKEKGEEKKDEKKEEGKKQEEGIQKMLAGNDTVVIFPESVSDHDETENQEESQNTPEEEYTLKCVHCTETFTRASLLRDHMRSSHPDLPVKYQCPKCEDTFNLKSHLDKHLALHSPTSQVCKVCNKTFANVYRLQRHMISHDESTDLRKFKCPTCGKAFKFKHHLKEHIRIHSGEKPFECANCGKRFSHSGSYSSHMNSKKCWVLNMKSRRIDRTTASDTVNGMLFRPVGLTSGGSVSTPLQSPPPGAYPGQFLKYDARGTVVPTLYSPPMTTAGFAAAYSMLAAGKAIPLPAHHHPPSIIPTSLGPALPISCPKLTELSSSSSPASSRAQISPDVNFNTQLFNLASGGLGKSLKEAAAAAAAAAVPPKDKDSEKEEEKEVKREVKQEKEEETEEKKDDKMTSKETSVCRHCSKTFESPIELHQHERYLCKLNKDIIQLMPGAPPPTTTPTTTSASPAISTPSTDSANACASPGSAASDRSRHATPSSSVCDTATTDDEDEEGAGGDGKKYRMRSLISEEQQSVLKTKYRENPRPDKAELVRIATEVGFSKRVVQVWFQNMRARDRRRGKEVPYFPNMARFKGSESATTTSSSSSTVTTSATGPCVPAYIPIVPQIFTSAPRFSSGATLRGLSSHNSSTDLPLDLSVRRQPPKAHSNSSSPAPPSSSSPFACQDQALDLCTKAPTTPAKDEAEVASETKPVETKDSSLRFQHSSIFKYLQQEGLFKNPLKVPSADSAKTTFQTTTAQRLQDSIRSQLLARKIQASSSSSSSSPKQALPPPSDDTEEDSKTEDVNPKTDENGETQETESQPDDLDLSVGESRLVIDENCIEKDDDDMENEDDGDDSSDDEDEEDEESCHDSAVIKAEAYIDHHNLDTLATVASLEELKQHSEGSGGGKSKRLRRKSRQMESADFILDLDDAVSTEDEDGPQRKRRKSWKGHKVDAELGMYACDQCDKMFSKQSSLARHKYEHSGARPFTCEVCSKAFKHKHHLTEHRRLHSGEKPFQCKKCGKRFSHSGSYSQHMNHRYKYCKPSDTEDE